MKYCFVLGTRPEIIKLYSTIHYCQTENIPFIIIHTNQHYSENMDKVFFDELQLPPPNYNLGINQGSHGDMTGRMLIEIEKILLNERPDVVIVQGDTNSVLAGGLAAAKLGIKVAHVEAGLRSYDRSMPEEINRIIVDHISDYLLVPTARQESILLNEGIDSSKISIVGNTVVDAVYSFSNNTIFQDKVLQEYQISPQEYILFTAHRPSNVDQESSLKGILEAVIGIKQQSGKKVLFLVHPRTYKNIHKFGLETLLTEFIVGEPVGFLKNIALQKNAYMTVTDSGGMQEESCILQTKTLVLRENTERPETLEVGGSLLVGGDKTKIMDAYQSLCNKKVEWYNPFGDGLAYKKILQIISS